MTDHHVFSIPTKITTKHSKQYRDQPIISQELNIDSNKRLLLVKGALNVSGNSLEAAMLSGSEVEVVCNIGRLLSAILTLSPMYLAVLINNDHINAS